MSSTGHLPELESLRSQVAGLARELAERDRAMQTRQQGVDGELQDLRKQSDLLRAIMEGTAADTGDDFFASLAAHLTSTLHMQYAVIGEVLEKTPASIRTLAVSSGGTLLENFEYDLATAPCRTGLTESFWCFEQGVQALFPNFPPLAAMGVESHSGVSIRNQQGKVVGLIVVMDTQPIAHQDRLQTLLQIFAPRVAAELQRKQAEAARRETERRLRFTQFAVDHAVDGVLWADESRRFIYANDAACRSLGYVRDELLGLRIADIAPHHDPDRFQRRLDEIKQGGAAIYESVHRRKDGTEFPVETSVTYLEHEGKGYTCGIIRDITARKYIEQERLQALADLQNITETVPDIMFTLDTGGNLIRWNGRLAVVTGYRPEELLNKPALAFVPVEEQAQTAEAIQRAFMEGHAELDGHLLTRTGHTIPYHWTGAVLRDSSGRIIGITGIGRDVSEQKQAAESLHRQRHHLLEAQALAHLGSWEWDIESGETDWSEEQFRIFGHEPGAIAVTYDTFLAALLPDDHDRVLAAVNDALLGKSPLDLECRIVRPNGDIRVIHMRADVQRDATAHPIGMAGTALDITERKQTEEALRTSEERWHLAIQGSNDGIWDWNIQAGEIFFSARWKAMRGFADHDVSNHIDEWRSRIHPDDLDRVLQSIDRYLAKQASAFCEEYRVQRKDGSYMWILDRGVALWGENNAPLRMAGSETDISEHRQTLLRLEEQGLLLRSILDTEPACVKRVAADGTLLQMNEAGLAFIEADSFVNVADRSVYDLVAPEFLDLFRSMHEAVLQGASQQLEFQIVGLKGTRRWMDTHAVPLWNPIAHHVEHLAVTRDITEHKQAEALRQAQKQVLELVASGAPLRETLDTLVRLIEGQSDGMLGSILLLDEERLHLRHGASPNLPDHYTEAIDGIAIGPSAGSCGTAAFLREMVIVEDIAADPLWDNYRHHALPHGLRSCWSVPLASKGTSVLGTFALYYREPRRPSPHDLQVIEHAARLAAIAIERKQAEDVLAERVRLATFSAEISAALNRSRSIEEALDQCAELVVEHVGAAFAGIWTATAGDQCGDCANTALCTDQSRCLHLKVSAGLSTALHVEYQRIPLGALEIGQIAQGMRVLSINDILNDERLPNKDWIRENGLQSFAGFPLYVADKVFGVLAVFARSPLSAATLQALESASNGVAATITRKQAEDALQLTKFSVDRAADAVYWIDPHAKIVDVNDAASAMLGYSREELCAMTVHDLTPDFQADMWPGFGTESRRRTMGFETFHRAKNGRLIPIEVRVNYLSHGGKEYHCAFVRDITERKLNEEALRESEARYRTLVELSPSGVFVFSEGQLVYVNSMAMTILGATEPNDILARAPFEFIHPDYHEDVTKNLRRVLAGETTVHRAERVYLKMDGTPIHVQVEAVRITWNGKPAIQGFFSDITERRQAEHKLRLTQFTIDHAVEAIYWIDPHANIVDVNEAAREMLGYSKEDLCAMTVHDLNPDFQADRWPGFWAETQRRGTMVFETSHRTHDGRLLPVEIQVNYLSYEGQEFHCAFVRDITERKRAQEELRRSKTRLTYILESNPAVVYTRQVGNGWPFTFITPNVYELLGYTSIDILTDPDRLDQSIHPDDDRDIMTTGMPQLLSNGAQTFVYRLRRRNGRYCWIENRARLNDDGQGTLQIVGTMLDITQRKQAEEALTTSERQLRTVLDSLPIGVWFTDRTGKTLLANPAAKQIWSNIKQVGLQSQENPSGWWETLEPANEPHRWALSHALTTGEASLNETLDLEDIDGRRKTIRNTTVPVKEESGTTIGAVILNEDLTDLRRIQEALKLTQFSVDHAVEAFFWIGPDAKILHVNEAACRMLEYTSDELTNMTVHDIDPNFPLEAWATHWEELKQNGALTFESKHWSRTGRVLDTEVTVNYLQYEGSEYNCTIIRDIGERKQAEEALRQSEERFRLLVEGAPLGITLLDEHFCYVKVNQAFCHLVGYREEEILGQTSALFIHSDDRTSNLAVAAEANRGERASYRLEKRYIRKNKQPIWVTVNATSLPLRGNTDHHMVAIIEDITERKQLAEREASRVRQLKKLSELSMTLSGDPAVVFDQVVRIIGELFNVQVVCLSEIVGEELHFKSVYIDGQILRSEEHCPLAITPCATVAQAKDMRIFDRVMEPFPQATFLKDHEAYTYCGFPALDSHGTVVAVTCLLDNKRHEFAEEEHELLRIIGQRIAVEIERSRHISEKQQAEDALRQNHALLSAIMDATMDIVFVKDLEGRYLHMNPAGARVAGRSPQEIVGKDDDAIWPADLAACCKEADRQILATGSAQTMEESTLANGKRITYLTTKAPYRDAAGHMIGIIGVAHDISQIKQSEEDLRRSHAFIRQIIDTDPNFIFAKDREGRFTLVNKAVADAYGTTVDHLTGKTDADFNSNTRELAHFRKIDLDVLDSLREQFVPEEMITDAAGRTRWLQTVKRPIMDETGRATMVLGACTDITERKRMEEALRQRERDLRTALDERERISQDLHDGILQSLYAVGLGLEACKPLMTQRHYKKAAASMDRAIGHLNHVMSEVRNFIAGLESQILQGSTFPMALRTMVLTLTADHPIPCTLTIDESLANTFSTEQALHLLNVVREALSNSLRHAGATKTTVSLKSLSRAIRLTIADNGRGFDPASLRGAGHGLTNMEARTRKVGGRFAIRSVPQHGTRITIDLPKETDHAESESDHGSTAARR